MTLFSTHAPSLMHIKKIGHKESWKRCKETHSQVFGYNYVETDLKNS